MGRGCCWCHGMLILLDITVTASAHHCFYICAYHSHTSTTRPRRSRKERWGYGWVICAATMLQEPEELSASVVCSTDVPLKVPQVAAWIMRSAWYIITACTPFFFEASEHALHKLDACLLLAYIRAHLGCEQKEGFVAWWLMWNCRVGQFVCQHRVVQK